MARTILVTGASSGFGATAHALADAGHVVSASMRIPAEDKVERARAYSARHNVDLRTVTLDVRDEASVDAVVAQVIAEQGWIDVLVHNAGHLAFGPAEAFAPGQFAELYGLNVVGPQRLNRPHCRTCGSRAANR